MRVKKHISVVELGRKGVAPDEEHLGDEPPYHKDYFCLLCGYETEGDRLYMEIHGSDGASNAVRQIESAQPYVCMECVEQFRTISWDNKGRIDRKRLTDFIRAEYEQRRTDERTEQR